MLEKDIYKQFEKDGVKVLVIGREETPEKIKAFREKHKLTLPFAADVDKKVYSLFATKFIPRTYVMIAPRFWITAPAKRPTTWPGILGSYSL